MTEITSVRDFLEAAPIGVQKGLTIGRPIMHKVLPTRPSAQNPEKEKRPSFMNVVLPRIYIFCDGECTGERWFDPTEAPNSAGSKPAISIHPADDRDVFVRYLCGDCRQERKLYAIRVSCAMDQVAETDKSWEVSFSLTKIGEVPKPTTPLNKKIKKLIENDWQLYRKGADDEAASNGIGAFAYYRRVVEDSRDQIVDAICGAMKKLDVDEEDIQKVAATKRSQRFSESIDEIKDYIPRDLFIAGTNPLTALYGTLSDGLHNASDEKCLEAARYIRTVLDAFGQKLQTVFEDHENVALALKKLRSFGAEE